MFLLMTNISFVEQDVRLLARNVQEYTEQRLQRYIEELRELCLIDTHTYYKPGLDKIAYVLGQRLEGLGLEVSIVEQEEWGNDLLAIIRGEGQGNILLLGHSDTVYPVGTAERYPVRIEGSCAYGPGTADMKGGILSAVYALEALLALGYRDFGEIRVLIVSDEEIPQIHCEDLFEQALRNCDVTLALEAGRTNGDIVSARKAAGWYKLSARGHAAHAGTDLDKGRNAVIELAHQMLQFQSLNGWRPGLTISPGVFSGGVAFNVVPDYAEVLFDLRYLDIEDRIATEKRWREMMKQQRVPDVELTLEPAPAFKEPMLRTPESMQLAAFAKTVAASLGFEINDVLAGGAGDAGYSSLYGVPVLDGLGPVGIFAHSPNKYLRLDTVAPRVSLLAALIARVGSQGWR